MLNLLFQIILAANIFIALFSFVFAFVFLRRGGNKVYFNYGMSVLFVGLWTSVTLADFYQVLPLSTNFLGQLGFFTGLWILHYFLLFSYYFSFSELSSIKKSFFYFCSFAISVMVMLPNYLILDAGVDFPFRFREINPIPLTIYNLYFLVLAIFAFHNLFSKFSLSDGIRRKQLTKIIYGTLIAVIANLIFSLINFYYQSFDLTHVGMVFTFVVIFYIYSILYQTK